MGTVVVGTGTVGTKEISQTEWPNERGLTAGTTKHRVDDIDYDDEIHVYG